MAVVLPNYWLRQGVRPIWEFAKDQARFWRGYIPYLLARRNDWGAFYALRRIFCATNGRFNDVLTFCTRFISWPYAIDTTSSLVPGLTPDRVAKAVWAIDRDGYYIFDLRMPADICDALIEFAGQTPMTVMDEEGKQQPEKLRMNLASPAGIKYDASMEVIMQNPFAQLIAGDPGLLAIAQAYFRAKAVQDLVAMWWSLPSQKPSAAVAQLYHFDMDRIKFLKFFLYLSDVGPENGPHCFVAGTHRRLPRDLRQDKRHTDEEVFRHLTRDREVEITGPKGTLCAVDTRGLHKGKMLTAGHRLLFQVEFAINLFGMQYPTVPLGDQATPCFKKMKELYPYSFANYS